MVSTALQIGRDLNLLESRARIVQLAGVEKVTSCLFFCWTTEFLAGTFDLVLLCHSLTQQERESIASSVRSWNPAALIVLVDPYPIHVKPGMDAVLDCAPERLVRELPQLTRAA